MKTTLFTCIAVAGIAIPVAGQTSSAPDTRAIRRAVEQARQHVRAVYVARDQRATESQVERITKTVKIGAEGELVLANVSGDIVVTKGTGTTATIDIVKTARARTPEEAKEMLGLVQVDVVERGSRAEVTTRYPQQDKEKGPWMRRGVNVSVDYTISAPEGTRLTVKSYSGDVKVSDIKGELSVQVMSGDVTLNNATRIGSTKVMSGDIYITDARLENGLDVNSVSGNVILRRVRATRIGVGSVSGNVVLTDLDCDRTEAQSMSGNVEYASPLAKNGRYDFKSHSGEVRIHLPGATGFQLEANSFTGSVRSDLPMTLEGGERNPYGPGRGTVRGTYGDGSAMLNVTTFSGSIVISKK